MQVVDSETGNFHKYLEMIFLPCMCILTSTVFLPFKLHRLVLDHQSTTGTKILRIHLPHLGSTAMSTMTDLAQ